MTMTLSEAIQKAVAAKDARALSRLTNTLRHQFGMTYEESKEFFEKCSPGSAESFESLMQLVEEFEAAQ